MFGNILGIGGVVLEIWVVKVNDIYDFLVSSKD